MNFNRVQDVLNKCKELGIKVSSKDDELDDDVCRVGCVQGALLLVDAKKLII